MIVGLVFENFRGKTGQFDLSGKNRLRGRNGAGKSTFKEAVCFLFTGQDSDGNRAPVHLISEGASGCRVEVRTSRATISRTLTQKKSSTLKLTRGDVVTQLTQTEFEGMLCQSDIFLSIFNCGYFMRMPPTKQKEVLTQVLPRTDRFQLWQHLSGLVLEPHEMARYDLTSKRVDLVEAKVSEDRRVAQNLCEELKGKLSVYDAVPKDVTEPIAPPAVAEASHWESIRRAWKDYHLRMNSYTHALRSYDHAKELNRQNVERRDQLERELSSLKFVDLGEAEASRGPLLAAIEQLKKERLPMPQPPALQREVDSENCPTCGQTVGLKHRERVRTENQRLMTVYDESAIKVTAFNSEIDAQSDRMAKEISALDDSIATMREINRKLQIREAQLKAEIHATREQPLPPVPEKPMPPEEMYDQEKAKAAEDGRIAYERKRGEFDLLKRQRDEASRESASIVHEISRLEGVIGRLRQLEESLRALPQAELAHQAAALELDGYRLVVGEGKSVGIVDQRGCPYGIMSTGERMKADIALSLKLNSLLKRPVGTIFVDNADLADDLSYLRESPVQFFFAEVCAEMEDSVVSVSEAWS